MGYLAHMGDRTDNRDFVGILERKRQIGRSWHRWKGNIQTDLPEIKCYHLDGINLALDKDN